MEGRCVRYEAYGDPQQVLRVAVRPIAPPGQGELLVRMRMRPINPSDLFPVRGIYAHRTTVPAIPGYEGVGVVEEVGAGVSSELLGRRVLPLRGEGTWQEYVRTQAQWAVSIPDGVDDESAAQLYINPLTAWLVCADVLALRPGDVLLVNAGGSAIGRLFAQLSRLLGFRLLAVTGDPSRREELLRLGADDVLTLAGSELIEAVRERTSGRGATAAVDSIGGTAGANLASCVRPGSTVLTIGLMSGIAVDWGSVSRETGVRVKLFHLRHWNAQTTPRQWQAAFGRLTRFVESGRLVLPAPAAHFPLEAVHQAVRLYEAAEGREGKIVLTE